MQEGRSSRRAAEARDILRALGVGEARFERGSLDVTSPVDGELLGRVQEATPVEAEEAIRRAHDAFLAWRRTPAPRRGELLRLFAQELRANGELLARLMSLEIGKVLAESRGEVQEVASVCDLAVGTSRQIHGVTLQSEQPGHRLIEQWHPIGVVGVITAFNFPIAVWSWNAALALVCGASVVWKPSEKTLLTALATQSLFERAAAGFGGVPDGLLTLLVGGPDIGRVLVDDGRVPVISATGSTRMGRSVGERVARRFGRAILELGGNNASIVTPSADVDAAVQAIVSGVVNTTGQRCTSLRRLIVHESLYGAMLPKLVDALASVSVGDPLDGATRMGPLIDERAFDAMRASLEAARALGGVVHGGSRVDVRGWAGSYVSPALVEMPAQAGPVLEETFAPILYVMRYRTLDEALALQNGVNQGLSSSIFATDVRDIERFLSAEGSDCGIANVNIGTVGPEIGGAFGGEKGSGGGRENGLDAWKAYMRRQTSTLR